MHRFAGLPEPVCAVAGRAGNAPPEGRLAGGWVLEAGGWTGARGSRALGALARTGTSCLVWVRCPGCVSPPVNMSHQETKGTPGLRGRSPILTQ